MMAASRVALPLKVTGHCDLQTYMWEEHQRSLEHKWR